MNEERYASRVRQALNHGLKDISPASARRLEAARHLALSRQKQAAPQVALAGNGAPSFRFRFASDNRYLRQILADARLPRLEQVDTMDGAARRAAELAAGA